MRELGKATLTKEAGMSPAMILQKTQESDTGPSFRTGYPFRRRGEIGGDGTLDLVGERGADGTAEAQQSD